MRPRKSKEPSKVGAYVITGLIIFLMVASAASVMLYRQPAANEFEYNGHIYTIDTKQGFYLTEIGKQTLRFTASPSSAFGVKTEPAAIALIKAGSALAVTFDPDDTDQLIYTDFARYELGSILPNVISATIKSSTTYLLPVVGCANATVGMPVLEFRAAPIPGVRIGENPSCVIIEGNQTSLLLAKDALLYRYYGLLPDETLGNETA